MGTKNVKLYHHILLAIMATTFFSHRLAAETTSAQEAPKAETVAFTCVYGAMTAELAGFRKRVKMLRAAEYIEFKLDARHDGWLILPNQAPSTDARPWIWYSPQSISDTWTWERLLDAGFAIAGTHPGELHGNPEARRVYTLLYNTLTEQLGLDKKACLMPQSRGGLFLYNWAVEHPDAVCCSGGIYPVCDIRHWPPNFNETCEVYGLSEEEMREQLPRHNPIQNLDVLAKRKIPIFHITGDQDKVVPPEKHSLAMQQKYRELGGFMEVEIVPGKGHEVCPEIFHSQRLVDFFIRHGLPQ